MGRGSSRLPYSQLCPAVPHRNCKQWFSRILGMQRIFFFYCCGKLPAQGVVGPCLHACPSLKVLREMRYFFFMLNALKENWLCSLPYALCPTLVAMPFSAALPDFLAHLSFWLPGLSKLQPSPPRLPQGAGETNPPYDMCCSAPVRMHGQDAYVIQPVNHDATFFFFRISWARAALLIWRGLPWYFFFFLPRCPYLFPCLECMWPLFPISWREDHISIAKLTYLVDGQMQRPGWCYLSFSHWNVMRPLVLSQMRFIGEAYECCLYACWTFRALCRTTTLHSSLVCHVRCLLCSRFLVSPIIV